MWRAVFTDGKVISEVEKSKDGREKEHTFKEVLDNLDTLENLSVIQNNIIFTVSMKSTKFTINIEGIEQNFYALDKETVFFKALKNIRPIYFIRERIDFKVGINRIPKQEFPTRKEFIALGFQASLNDQNIKRYLAISPSGLFTIEHT